MAYLAQLGALTDELVAAVRAIPETQRQRLDLCRESTLRALRYHNFARTNQFEVEDRLNGLEERFRVTGRDALADEFRKRLDALEPFRDKWTPDVLHFILELADQPAQKSDLSNLHLLAAPEEDTQPGLTWQDIAREDGWHEDKALWRNINYASSSDDDNDHHYRDHDGDDARSRTSAASLSSISSSTDQYRPTVQQLTIKSPDGELQLTQVRESQIWRHADHAVAAEGRLKKRPISNLQFLREALFMLGDLETTLFDSRCEPVTTYQLADVSWQTHKALATSFAECGRKLAPLRDFVKRQQQVPLLQVFQDSLQKALRSFDRELAAIQGRFVSVQQDVVVSLLAVLAELSPYLLPLYALSGIIQQLQEERNPHAFRYLELLFDAVGMAQIEGRRGAYALLGRIFFDCFQVYLKPIRLWMEEGKLVPGDRTFFVSGPSTKQPLHQIWKSRFNLLRSPEGTLHAPRFLQPAITRIFTTGKSIVVLKHLKQHESLRKQRDRNEPQMDFATVCPEDVEFAPFSELFGAAFDGWIQSKHHTASATLHALLFNSYGLSQGLDALEYIYLMSDGSKSHAFASAVFRHLDSFSAAWKDRFTLTEIAQEAFSTCVDTYRLSAEVGPHSVAQSATASRSSVRLGLPTIRLGYRLPWPVRIIVPEEAIEGYHRMFTFLLQIRRTIFVLTHPILSFQADRDGSATDRSPKYYLLRTKTLWFCNILLTYLTTLVLAPSMAKLRDDLRNAVDVDEMVAAHAEFINRITSESCQGPKLQPIRDCILDILDLAIKAEDTHRAEMVREAEEDQESSRLSVMSPFKSPSKSTRKAAVKEEEQDMVSPDVEAMMRKSVMGASSGKPYAVAMRDMHADFERHLRFVAGGLRGVARASREKAAGKWDMLAEMLEVGIRD
ncbi:Spc98 family-domain-containing protein [Apodospora peruviana]|uniref:Spindle pole body component n=1 Tax=Apodospora peruviana TaxID=516989 RepID=A0AAE0MBF5_9PEZI|nr:Spc98 family-domain-containing protein [Apodospora peruviana]